MFRIFLKFMIKSSSCQLKKGYKAYKHPLEVRVEVKNVAGNTGWPALALLPPPPSPIRGGNYTLRPVGSARPEA